MLIRIPLRDRARGRWSGILPALGIGESFLTGKHGPCPLCGGKDRWRWDNLEGRGTRICSKCGAGDGVALVMRKNGLDFCEAAKQSEKMIGSAPTDMPKRERSNRDERGMCLMRGMDASRNLLPRSVADAIKFHSARTPYK
jgi:putative DNA primase/helicase